MQLPVFEGPLDLLLHLIQKHEIDIFDIPIAFVTEEYLRHLDLMEAMDLDVAGEFLVMAATLAHIKSRMLLPRPEPDPEGEPEEDPREALVRWCGPRRPPLLIVMISIGAIIAMGPITDRVAQRIWAGLNKTIANAGGNGGCTSGCLVTEQNVSVTTFPDASGGLDRFEVRDLGGSLLYTVGVCPDGLCKW